MLRTLREHLALELLLLASRVDRAAIMPVVCAMAMGQALANQAQADKTHAKAGPR